MNDNFFELGGNSVSMVRLHRKLQDLLGREIPLTQLFAHPTPGALAALVDARRRRLPARRKPRTRRQAPGGTRPPAPPGTALRSDEKESHERPEDDLAGIAVVGYAGRFPGAADPRQLGSNLRDGVESIRLLSDEELAGPASRPPSLLSQLRAGGRLSRRHRVLRRGVLRLQPARGRDDRSAAPPLPRMRLGGAGGRRLRLPHLSPAGSASSPASRISSYLLNHLLTNPPGPRHRRPVCRSLLGNDKDFLATRVSYKLEPARAERQRADRLLDLAGGGPPRLPEPAQRRVRHGARRRRLDRTCRKAGYLYQAGGILSPDGHCRAFDAAAAGTVFGNGVGVVVLKRLDDALADGDPIHAVIRGSAVNNDGSRRSATPRRASRARPR